MNLCQLPQHIVSDIVAQTVSASRIKDALRLRLVNKQFDQEVIHICFQKHLVEFISRSTHIKPSTTINFRLFRGFLLSLTCTKAGRLSGLRRHLLDAAKKLTLELQEGGFTRPADGKFFDIYSSNARQESPSEEAIAVLGEVVIECLAGMIDICQILATQHSNENRDVNNSNNETHEDEQNDLQNHDVDDDEASEMQVDEDNDSDHSSTTDDEESEFEPENHFNIDDIINNGRLKLALECTDFDVWVLMTAGYFGNQNLLEKTMTAIRGKQGVSVSKFLRYALRLSVLRGHRDMVKFILDQPEVDWSDVKQDGRDVETILETAIRSGQVLIVQDLMQRGWNIQDSFGDLAAALMIAIKHTADPLNRKELVVHLLSLTNEWRSESFTGGMLRQVFTKGDLELAQLVVDTIKSDTSDHSDLIWFWNLPGRYNDDYGDDWDSGEAIFSLICSHDAEFLRFFFANEKCMPKAIRDCTSRRQYTRELEGAIDRDKLEIFQVLLKHDCMSKIPKDKLLVYTTARGNPKFLDAVLEDFDLGAKIPDHSMYWLQNSYGSSLRWVLGELEIGRTPYLYNANLMTIGSFCLGIAIKALKCDNAKYFLDRGVQLGIRLYYLTANFFAHGCSRLLVPTDADIGSWAFGIARRRLYLRDAKAFLEGGVPIREHGLILSQKKDSRGVNLRSFRMLHEGGAKAIVGIHISCKVYEQESMSSMNKLLKSHHMPWVYRGDCDCHSLY